MMPPHLLIGGLLVLGASCATAADKPERHLYVTSGAEIADGYHVGIWNENLAPGSFHVLEMAGGDPTKGFISSWRTGETGDMILSVGRRTWEGYASWARRIDELPATMPCTVKATKDDWGLKGKYYFSLMAWSQDQGGWSGSTERDELYVCEDYSAVWEDPKAFIGTLDYDGSTYQVYKIPATWSDMHQWTWMAFRDQKRTSGTIDLVEFLKFFRKHGLKNHYLTTVVWAIEGNTNTMGRYVYESINIPNIRFERNVEQ